MYDSCTRKAVPTGMIAGAMGQFLASPTDLVKVRLQMEGRRVLDGYKPRYTSLPLLICCRALCDYINTPSALSDKDGVHSQ